MPCPAVLAAAAEGGTRLAHDPASASEAAMASTAVGAAGGSAGDRTTATEAVDAIAASLADAGSCASLVPEAVDEAQQDSASAAVGPKDATEMELASALAGEAALGLPAACASTGPWSCRAGGTSWLCRGMPWGMAMLMGVS